MTKSPHQGAVACLSKAEIHSEVQATASFLLSEVSGVASLEVTCKVKPLTCLT